MTSFFHYTTSCINHSIETMRSYSCLPNIKSVINTRKMKILYPSPIIGRRRTCNCISMPKCPRDQRFPSKNILYQANIIPMTRIQKLKFTTAFMKQHLNYDMQITRNRSTTETACQILSCLTSFGK